MNGSYFDLDDTRMFSALMESSADSIYFKDRECRLIRVSQHMADTLSVKDPADLVGKTDSELFGEEFGAQTRADDEQVMRTGQPIIGLVEAHHLPDGSVNWTSTTKLPVRNENGEIVGLLGITREINDLKKTEIELEFIATHDILTSLPNRYLFFGQLQQIINRAHRHPQQAAILYIDLDHFKEINDTCGHDAGDVILKQVAELLQSVLREDDLVARLGGDEFVILLSDIQGPADAASVAERIIAQFDQVFRQESALTPSIGISLYPLDSDDTHQLIHNADQAMYRAKQIGNTYKYYQE
jgi:diguanylate cyclase (GGDEF)-like protein/PAS domain S-box-containing protein